jgi:predicted HTH transcriptional regulator
VNVKEGKSIQKIIKALSSNPKTTQQLLQITKLPERTLRYNLAILKSKGFVKEIFILNDMRKKLFYLNGGENG